MEHYLKTHPEPFEHTNIGLKTFEFRFNDRGYETGDALVLEEYDPRTGVFSGRRVRALVTHLLRGGEFGVPDGFVVMSIRVVARDNVVPTVMTEAGARQQVAAA